MSTQSPLHAGRPRALIVNGEGTLSTLSGTYDLDLTMREKPVWRMQCPTRGSLVVPNAEITQEEGAPNYTWVMTQASQRFCFASSEPSGQWEDGLVVSALIASPTIIASWAFPFPQLDYNFYLTGGASPEELAEGIRYESLLTRSDLLFLHTTEGEQIPAIYRRNPSAEFSLIYSHGNSEDIGTLFPYFDYLANRICVNVLAYEYVGYSLSRLEGCAPSEEGCYRAAVAAWTYLTTIVPAKTIILYGRSIGSGPTVELATRECASTCAGIILESPIASGARCAVGSIAMLVWFADIFVNYEKMDKIKSPITIMHGKADTIVSIDNGQELFEKVDAIWRRPPLWIEGCGHNDMPKDLCWDHVVAFLTALRMSVFTDV